VVGEGDDLEEVGELLDGGPVEVFSGEAGADQTEPNRSLARSGGHRMVLSSEASPGAIRAVRRWLQVKR
jgi:hypothetical protein